jgi:hypothetical protein
MIMLNGDEAARLRGAGAGAGALVKSASRSSAAGTGTEGVRRLVSGLGTAGGWKKTGENRKNILSLSLDA